MIITVKILNNFLSKFDVNHNNMLKEDKIKASKKIIARYKLPKRYLEGLSGDEKLLRQIELVSKKRMTRKERFSPLKSDKIARSKGIPKSGSCTMRWKKIHAMANDNKSKARITGIPKHILDKVENKGRGSYYSSGSRPGQTSISWGKARVNCFILKKSSVVNGPDKDLYLKALKSPRAREWFKTV